MAKEKSSENKGRVIEKLSESNLKNINKEDIHNAVLLKNLALYSIFRKLIGLAVLLTICVGICIGGVVYFNTAKIEPQYVSVDAENKISKELPLNEPNLNDGEVAFMAVKAIKALNTYDYKNYAEQLSAAGHFFTNSGWENYQKSLDASGNLRAVVDNKRVVSVTIKGESKVVAKRVDGDVFRWKVEVPAFIAYTTAGNGFFNDNNQSGVFEIYFERTPLKINPDGIAISLIRLDTSRGTNDK